MRKILPFILLILTIAILAGQTEERLQVESPSPLDVEKYLDWSVDDVRPGMSLAEARKAYGEAEFLARVDYFGAVYTLYDGSNVGWRRSGHFVVNEFDQVVSVEGGDLKYKGVVQKDYLASIKSMDTLIRDQCRLRPPMLHGHKFRSPGDPVVVRGVYFETYILGEEPEWLALCYRGDELGDCLESLSHLQRTLAEAERYEPKRPETLEELSEYAGEKFMARVRCPLGGAYRLSGHTATCFSHPEGPISVTRRGKNCRFWQGAPE